MSESNTQDRSPLLRIGVLAASEIAGPAVIEPARQLAGVEVVAVASRAGDTARRFAERWGLARWYGTYGSLLDDDDIDAVYVSTPASLHRPWTVEALRHGKHVLCEKPLAANADDAREIAQAADESGLVVMEALHWRYHPLVGQMSEVVERGRLGAIRDVEGWFMVPAARIPAGDIRWDLGLGGGAMMDLGVYPASWLRWLVDDEPWVVSAVATCPVPDVDGALDVSLRWGSGVTGRIRVSMVWPADEMSAGLAITGDVGTMRVDNPLAPQLGSSLEVTTPDGVERLAVSTGPTYQFQLSAFRRAVIDGEPYPTTAWDAVLTMELIDSVYRTAGLPPRPRHR